MLPLLFQTMFWCWNINENSTDCELFISRISSTMWIHSMTWKPALCMGVDHKDYNIYDGLMECIVSNTFNNSVNTLRPGDTYMRQWNKSSSVHVVANRLFGTKPLKPMLTYYQLEPHKNQSMKFDSKYDLFGPKNTHLKIASEKRWSFCSWYNVLTITRNMVTHFYHYVGKSDNNLKRFGETIITFLIYYMYPQTTHS